MPGGNLTKQLKPNFRNSQYLAQYKLEENFCKEIKKRFERESFYFLAPTEMHKFSKESFLITLRRSFPWLSLFTVR